MAVRIRMKMMGRKHRPFFRICAIDSRQPRDGRVIEELGTYDPTVPDTDARALLRTDRIEYWLSVGALPSEKVAVLIKKYGPAGTRRDAQAAARERLAMPRAVPDPGAPKYVRVEKPAQGAAAPAAAAPAEPAAAPAEEAPAEGAAE